MSAAVTKINALNAIVASQGTCKSFCPVCNCPTCLPLNVDVCRPVCKPIDVTTCASFINPTTCAEELKKKFLLPPSTNKVATITDNQGKTMYYVDETEYDMKLSWSGYEILKETCTHMESCTNPCGSGPTIPIISTLLKSTHVM